MCAYVRVCVRVCVYACVRARVCVLRKLFLSMYSFIIIMDNAVYSGVPVLCKFTLSLYFDAKV